jgi:hypothetical protein
VSSRLGQLIHQPGGDLSDKQKRTIDNIIVSLSEVSGRLQGAILQD